MRLAPAILACAALAPLSGIVAPAQADVFGPIGLASTGAIPGSPFVQQADSASDSVLSANGRYVAFDGLFAGRTGVFRRDLLTDEVAIVAEGDAAQPSISADGRYVSFTTTASLDRENDKNAAPDVYVRDMEKPSTEPCPEGWEQWENEREACAFTLASAVNGSSVGLSYTYVSNPQFEATHEGSVASGRSALSADGREVAFETTAISNLANPNRTGAPVSEEAETPAAQIAVRNLETKATTLVTVRIDQATRSPQLNAAGQPEPVPASAEGGYGAVYPSGTKIPPFPSETTFAGASLSADGSTVAWMGQQIKEQAPVMPGFDLADEPEYTEPLWRRIGEGGSASTRRVTGGSDPTNPACEASGETQTSSSATLSDPCQGPFDTSAANKGTPGVWTLGTADDYLPRLSANGEIVALLATAREVASGEEATAAQSSDDLYVVDMREGLSRVAATRRLTEIAGGPAEDPPRTGPILDLGVSPDGSQVAFSSERTIFPLGSPAYVSAPYGINRAAELYDVDLEDDTLTRVTQSFEGGQSLRPEGPSSFTGSPSFAEGGNVLAFSSNSDNLVYGDGNQNSDAFVVSRVQFASSPAVSEITAPPANPSLVPPWKLGATASSRRNGTVVVDVLVPGAGSLRAGAQSAVRVKVRARSAARRAHRARRGGPARTTVATRTVASAAARPGGIVVVPVTLRLARAYSSLASSRGGLSATVTLSFSATGRPTLRERIAVTFVRTPTPHKSKRHPAKKRSGR